MVEEILFWKFNIRKFNNKSLHRHEIPHLFIYSDASNTGLEFNLSFIEATSSTWKQLEAIMYYLDSMKKLFKNNT